MGIGILELVDERGATFSSATEGTWSIVSSTSLTASRAGRRPSTPSCGRSAVDPLLQDIEVGTVSHSRRSGADAAEKQCLQLKALLILADRLPNVLAAGPEAAAARAT